MRRKMFTLLAAIGLLATIALPAVAAAEGYIQAEMPVGYFYGEFGPGPNALLFVGGSAVEFCLESPDDPFAAEPGSGTFRIYERQSGAVEIKANQKGQPMYLYEFDGEVPDLLFATCDALFDGDPSTIPLEPLASGTGNLKVRLGINPDGTVDVFNSVIAKLTASDGSQWKVRASADLVVVDDVPQGDPADFVSIAVHQIGG